MVFKENIMATVTYAQVVKFYKNSKETTTCLNNFLKQHAQQRGGYISLWNTFREQGTSGQEDDCTFYSLLQQRKKENSLGKLQAFQGMSNEQINKFIFDDFGDIPNSKWHVFVAYMAYQELNNIHKFSTVAQVNVFNETTFPKDRNIPAKDFWLWLIESAAIATRYEKITQDDIENFYSAAKGDTNLNWHKIKNDLWDKTKEVINEFE